VRQIIHCKGPKCFGHEAAGASGWVSSAQKIISQGTNWRFFNELKQELKG